MVKIETFILLFKRNSGLVTCYVMFISHMTYILGLSTEKERFNHEKSFYLTVQAVDNYCMF